MNTFKSDFAPLEKSLRREARLMDGAIVMTPERMVIELRLTPAKIRHLGKQIPILKRPLTETYWVLRRHQMLPSQLKLPTKGASDRWDSWMGAYTARRNAKAQSKRSLLVRRK